MLAGANHFGRFLSRLPKCQLRRARGITATAPARLPAQPCMMSLNLPNHSLSFSTCTLVGIEISRAKSSGVVG